MGRSLRTHEVYLIDFGLARLFRSPHTGQHIGLSGDCSLVGTPYYSSLDTLLGIEQSRKDDLEALGYMLVSFLLGQLPWLLGSQARTSDEQFTLILQGKIDHPPEILCRGLPYEFLRYFDYCRALGFSERPDYLYLHRLFRSLAHRERIVYDYIYDWTRSEPTVQDRLASNSSRRNSSAVDPRFLRT